MATSYTLWLSTPTGTRLAAIDTWLSLDYTRSVNAVGSLKLAIRGDYPLTYLTPDTRLEVWRSIDGASPYLDTETVWFLRKLDKRISKGQRTIEITAVSACELLSRRIVAYNAASAQATKTAAADDMMKAIVSENMGALATDTTRSLASVLGIDGSMSSGPTITKAFARRNVLTTLQEIGQAAAIAGTPVFFDVVGSDTLTFRTYPRLRGLDQTFPNGSNPLILSPDLGNLDDVTLSYDYTGEVTFAYAAGQGEEANRVVATASDSGRMGVSPFNRREMLVDSRNTASSSALTAEAQAALREGRPRTILTGTIMQTPGTIYGRHWQWGSKITAQLDGQSFDCRVDTVQVSVKNGLETIKAQLRSEA